MMSSEWLWSSVRALAAVSLGLLWPSSTPTQVQAACQRCNVNCGPTGCTSSCPDAGTKPGFTTCTPVKDGCDVSGECNTGS